MALSELERLELEQLNREQSRRQQVTEQSQQQFQPQVQQADPFLGNQTLGNIGMTADVPGASSRAAIRENPLLALAGPLAGTAGLGGIGGEAAQQAAGQGAINPSGVETFQQQASQGAQDMISKIASLLPPEVLSRPGVRRRLEKELGSGKFVTGASALGFGADLATDPVAVLASLVTPLIAKGVGGIETVKNVKTLGGKIIKQRTNVGNIINEVLEKPIAVRAPKFFRKFLRRAKTPSGKVLKARATDAATAEQSLLKSRKDVKITKTEEQIAQAQAMAKEARVLNAKYSEQVLDDTVKTMESNVKGLTAELKTAADTGALKIQKKLPKIYKENSDAYGRRLDEISKALIKDGEEITVGEIDDILTNTIKHLDEAGITGRPRELIEKLVAKYSQKFISKGSKFNRASTGQPAGGSISSNVDDTVPFKELIQDMKGVSKVLSGGAKSGAKQFTQDDVAVAILKNNVGKYVKVRVPEFAKLQETYSPIIRSMRKSTASFKPFKGEFDTKTGSGLLERSALGKSDGGEERLLAALEKTTEFSKGIGPVRAPINKVGRELQEAKEAIKPVTDAMKKGSLLRDQNIDKRLAFRMDKLAENKKFIEGTFKVKEEMIKVQLKARLKEIGLREDQVANLTADRAKRIKTLKMLGVVGTLALGAAGIGVGFNALQGRRP